MKMPHRIAHGGVMWMHIRGASAYAHPSPLAGLNPSAWNPIRIANRLTDDTGLPAGLARMRAEAFYYLFILYVILCA